MADLLAGRALVLVGFGAVLPRSQSAVAFELEFSGLRGLSHSWKEGVRTDPCRALLQ